MTPLLAALGAAGLILASSLQNSLSNFESGLLIVFQRPFDVGDSIEAAGMSGTVKKVSLFSTHLSTDENKQVIVPNNMIWEDVVVNATGADTRRLAIEFDVNPEHSLSEVRKTLLEAMKAHPEVLDDPPPEVKLTRIGSDGMTFVCWPWVPTERRDQVRVGSWLQAWVRSSTCNGAPPKRRSSERPRPARADVHYEGVTRSRGARRPPRRHNASPPFGRSNAYSRSDNRRSRLMR